MTTSFTTDNPEIELEDSALRVPDSVSPEILKLLRQTFSGQHVEKGLAWVLDRMKDGESPLPLLLDFTRRFEEQMIHLYAPLEDHALLFRAGLFQKCLNVLPFFQIRFADKGYNPLFVNTWLQKQLVASLFGITQRDVEVKISQSGYTPPRYLEEQLRRFLPKTCLKQL
jgi:hypothetical protein